MFFQTEQHVTDDWVQGLHESWKFAFFLFFPFCGSGEWYHFGDHLKITHLLNNFERFLCLTNTFVLYLPAVADFHSGLADKGMLLDTGDPSQ